MIRQLTVRHDNDQTDCGIRVYARDRRDDKTARDAQAFLNWHADQWAEACYQQMLDGKPFVVKSK